MATRKQTGKAKSRPQAKPSGFAGGSVEAAVQTEQPELSLQATPLKTSRKNRRASGSRSPDTVAQLLSPELERKSTRAWTQESYEEPLIYEPHKSIPLDPDSQEALAMISANMVPLDLQRRGSSIVREFSVSKEADDRACKIDHKAVSEDDKEDDEEEEEEEEKFEVRLAVDDEQLDNEHEWVTIDRAVAQAVMEEHITTFLAEVPRLKWNKFRHKFARGKMYAGFVFYGVIRRGHFRVDHDSGKFPAGSVAIRRTDIASVQNAVSRESGLIHPQAFTEAFGLNRYPRDLVAEAFALGPPGSFERAAPDRAFGDSSAGELLCEGVEIRFNSSFNSSRARGGDRPGRDESRQMSPRMQEMLKRFLRESDWLRGFGGNDPEAKAEAKAAEPDATTARSQPRAERKQAKSRRGSDAPKKASSASDDNDNAAEMKIEIPAAEATPPSPAERKPATARKGKSASKQQWVIKSTAETKADTETKTPET